MDLKELRKRISSFKSLKDFKDIWYYVQGNVRYELYYSRFKFLIPKHILEQIDFRIEVMYPECLLSGFCIKCGCKTTALQMCNKSCEGDCYPEMMNKKEWKEFKNNNYAS